MNTDEPDFNNLREAGVYGPFGPDDASLPMAGIYTRLSTEKQLKENFSAGTQVDMGLSRLNDKLGVLKYRYIVYLEDKTGRLPAATPDGVESRGRSILGRLIADAEVGKLKYALFLHQDRLSREVPDAYMLARRLMKAGCQLGFMQQTMDLNTSSGWLQFGMTAVWTETEWMRLRERVSAGLNKRIHDGFWHGNPPYGWRRQGKWNLPPGQRSSLVRVEEEADVVKLIYNLFFAGWGYWKIVRELQKRGIASPQGKALWSVRTILSQLRTPCHAGLILVDGELGEAAHLHLQIVEPEKYRRAQEMLDRRKRIGPSTFSSTNHILGGLARCGGCGRRLYLEGSGNASRHYRCFAKKLQDPDACQGFMVKADKVEGAIYREIKALAESTELRGAVEAEITEMVTRRRREISAELGKLQKESADEPLLRRALLSKLKAKKIREDSIVKWQQDLDESAGERDARIAELQAELSDVGSLEMRAEAARKALADFRRVWDRLEIEEKREVLANLVESLSFAREGRNVIMRLKLIFREEKEITIPPDKREPSEKTGVRSLTQRQLAILDLLSEGLSRREIARRLGIEETAVNSHLWFVRKQLGVAAIEEAIELARPRIEVEREFLPKEGRSRPPMTRGGKLSPREIELLRRLAAGESLCGIARTYGKPVGSFSPRLTSAKRKLGVKTREEAIANAKEKGLI
jgi:DNA-binding NarL/FixJ family response regulator/DNA invertase Pin-like site-specific DNA recombinase